LKSRWFAFLCKTYLEAVVADVGSRPILQIADERIFKAYRRIVKRGAALDDDPPASALHRLRIDAKKLRYLLEFFRNLYPEELVRPRIKTLKQLQDVLGGFQDMEVQRERLESFGERVLASDTCAATTLLAMGELASVLRARQESFRLAFGDRFTPFASAQAQEEWRELCGAKKPKRTR
jgi:CHAD domain-containing protein